MCHAKQRQSASNWRRRVVGPANATVGLTICYTHLGPTWLSDTNAQARAHTHTYGNTTMSATPERAPPRTPDNAGLDDGEHCFPWLDRQRGLGLVQAVRGAERNAGRRRHGEAQVRGCDAGGVLTKRALGSGTRPRRAPVTMAAMVHGPTSPSVVGRRHTRRRRSARVCRINQPVGRADCAFRICLRSWPGGVIPSSMQRCIFS